jgi:hypothetical protein
MAGKVHANHGRDHRPGGTDPSMFGWESTGGTATSTAWFEVKVTDETTTLSVGDGKLVFMAPAPLNGMRLASVSGFVSTVSSSGTVSVQLRSITGSVDLLTTKVSIDANEYTSYSAATAPVVGTVVMSTGDLIAVDVDGAGTGAKGLGLALQWTT